KIDELLPGSRGPFDRESVNRGVVAEAEVSDQLTAGCVSTSNGQQTRLNAGGGGVKPDNGADAEAVGAGALKADDRPVVAGGVVSEDRKTAVIAQRHEVQVTIVVEIARCGTQGDADFAQSPGIGRRFEAIALQVAVGEVGLGERWSVLDDTNAL